MLFAIARFDAPDTFAAVENGNQLRARRVHFGQGGPLGIGVFDEGAVFVREILLATDQFKFAAGTKGGQLGRGDRHFDHPGIEVCDQDTVVLVVLRQQPERVGFDAQVDVFAHQDGLALGLGLLNAEGLRKDAVIHGACVEDRVAVLGGGALMKNDTEVPAVGQRHAFAQPACTTETVQLA